MKKTIFSKIFSGYIAIIFLLTFSITLFLFHLIYNFYMEITIKKLKSIAISLEKEISMEIKDKSYKNLEKEIKSLDKKLDTRITIILPDGTVVADSEKNPALMDNHKNRPEIMEANKKGIGHSLRFSHTVKKNMLYVAYLVKKDKLTYFIRTSIFVTEIEKLLNDIKTSILYLAIIVITISLLIAFFISNKISISIKKLKNAASKMASGDFSIVIDINNTKELKELGENFNHMGEKIETLIKNLELKKNELDEIIASLPIAFFLLDKDENILKINTIFKKTFIGNSNSRKLWQIFPENYPEFKSFLTKCKEEKRLLTKEINITDNFYQLTITYLEKNKEYIVLLQDITEKKRVEIIKKEFVANVSHELRTPLTAIKGYIETLEDELEGENAYYLTIIKRNSERLIAIVNDLMTLAQLENIKSIEFKKCDSVEILKNIILLYEKKAQEKNIEIVFKPNKEKIVTECDPFKIEQLFINLIDNAIKYSNGGKILINLEEKEKNLLFTIEDNGVGIPKEYLSRIFERFFVVDKSRSKKSGGTGLGLSIVKHIVMLHNGKISVESTQGVGTKFIISLPKKIK